MQNEILFLDSERKRIRKISKYEKQLSRQGYVHIAGVDEAGRGPLAGPVVAAACIVPKSFFIPLVNDSKQLTPKVREELYRKLMQVDGLYFGTGIVSVERIDEINILQATLEAMQNAVRSLPVMPDYVLVDGNQLPKWEFPTLGIVQGDALSVSIAAASIIAKVTRDRIMVELAREWPMYGFCRHKGYGTPEHVKAIARWGLCPHHRKTFHVREDLYC